ncbi:hypothetical protein ACSTJ6_23300, partial [Vibrio parahaemolyticus]
AEAALKAAVAREDALTDRAAAASRTVVLAIDAAEALRREAASLHAALETARESLLAEESAQAGSGGDNPAEASRLEASLRSAVRLIEGS